MHTLLHSVPPVLQQATADPHLHQRHSRANLGQSLMGSLLLSPGSWCAQGSVCALQESYFPCFELVLQLYSGVNHDLLQEGLCHTQVSCTQSLCPCSSPLLTSTSTGDAQTQFCLSLSGVLGSWCTQGLFEPSEGFWWEWGLILNANSPLLPSFWGFSFALGHGVSPHIHSNAYSLTGVSLASRKAQPLLLTLEVGYLLMERRYLSL